MHDKHDERAKQEEAAPKRPWQTPALKCVGTMEEVLLGAGKSGSFTDGDPVGSFKFGMG